MAYTQTLSPGPTYTLVQNTVYALPPRTARVLSTLAVEISPDGSTWSTLTGANTVGADASGSFLRCTTGAAVISLHYY